MSSNNIMKKVLAIISGVLMMAGSYAQQYFQGTLVKDPNNEINNRIIFKMNPTGSLTTAISYIETAFRYPTASTPAFVVAGLTSNTATFPGLNIQRLPDLVSGGFTYVKFVHNTATVASNTYTPSANGYELFSFALQGTPAVIPQIEMVSNLSTGDYVFGVVDGAGNLIDPGAGNQLYGPGFTIASGVHILPLTNVPVPVKFNGFTAIKKDNDGLLTWSVENESPVTDRYEIERSFNGVDFTKFATVAPKNNGLGSNVYNLTDANLSSLRTSSNIIYYRIKQTDKDGQFVYSEIRSIRLNGKNFSAGVYPNPVKDVAVLSIDLLENEPVSVMIIDAAGKQVQQIQIQGVKGLNVKKVNMGSFASGTYQFKVKTTSELKTISVVKE
jgi:Secretion system C-terminal sorting domain